MIIVKVPFRLPIGGGGTDLPAYYSRWECQLITATIDKYMYVSVNRPVAGDSIKLYYKYNEQVDPSDVDSIKHDIIRESLKLYGINYPLEIGSMADIDAGTGMGSSSVFTVGLLTALAALTDKKLSPVQIAEQACQVEMDLVGKPVGKQDQYAASLGGINQMNINKNGEVNIFRLNISGETIGNLQNRLTMFATPITRNANEILEEQSQRISYEASNETRNYMHTIKQIGREIKEALINGDIDLFGGLLGEHWECKKNVTSKMTNNFIEDCYNLAMLNGALGGKIMGAGGGGFFLFCADKERKHELIDSMERHGLKYMDFRFEYNGAKIINL